MSGDEKSDFDATAYWNKRYQTIDVTKSGHVDLPATYNRWLYRRKMAHLAGAMAKIGYRLSGQRLLEVAAGSGAWMDFWSRMGAADYLGVDLSERAVASLEERYPGSRFAQHDLNVGGLDDKSGGGYDCVTAIDVLYHILDDAHFANAIQEFASVLKPGGLLVLHDVFPRAAAIDHGKHIRWRTLSQYEHALGQAGMEVVYRRPSFLFMVQNSHLGGLTGRTLDLIWRYLTFPLVMRMPNMVGCIAFLCDGLACRVLHDGPSMELMLCRKKS